MTPNARSEELEHRALERLSRALEEIADMLSEAAELGDLPTAIRSSVLALMRETARLQGGVEWIVERVVVLDPKHNSELRPRIETRSEDEEGGAQGDTPPAAVEPAAPE